MTRIIKMRGMTIGGEWVSGLLSISRGLLIPGQPAAGYYISNNAGMPWAFQVRPETVGQFTGLLDKNGKEIWEGDIVTASWMQHGKPRMPFRAYILYNEHIGSFRIGYNSLGGGSQDEIYFRYQIEVIGNIYENQELLNP